MTGFSLAEVSTKSLKGHWQRGKFPLSFLAPTNEDSHSWRRQFIQTFLERDLPQLRVNIPAPALLRFRTMAAHSHGGIWNSADPARSLGIGESTVRRYLDLFTKLLVVRQLQPWHENLANRQVKSPKVYVRDSGLLHALLGIRTEKELLAHPKCRASWEGYVLEETLKAVAPDETYFWATHQGAELDLLLLKGGKRLGIEMKWMDAPTLTASMRIALTDLKLDQLNVVYPATKSYELEPRVKVMPVSAIATEGIDGIVSASRIRFRAKGRSHDGSPPS